MSGSSIHQVLYGPFVRLHSPTQSYEIALQILETGELWGRPARVGGMFPAAKAYAGQLCYPGARRYDCKDDEGIEFTTFARPTSITPFGEVRWYFDEDMPVHQRPFFKIVDEDTLAIFVRVTKIHYVGRGSGVYGP